MEMVEVESKSRRGRKRKINNVQNAIAGVGGRKKMMHTRSFELIGRYVQKEFKGSGVLLGRIQSYDSRLYRIYYEDDRCEDLISSKVKSILVEDGELTDEWYKRKEMLNELLSSKGVTTANDTQELEKANSFNSSSLSGVINSCSADGVVRVHNEVDADSLTVSDVIVPLIPPQLPPSSGDIGVPEECVPDLLSVYSFLRSFSVRLFLYPFVLNDFVGALNCSVANTLLDSVHVALMSFLKRQFEKTQSDGSELALKVLRCQDWSLLDTYTWPIYLVNYLLARGYGNGDDRKELFVHCLERDYYTLSVGKKLIALQILCDDVLNTEELRAEIDTREASEVGMDIDTSTVLETCKPVRVHPEDSKTSDCKDIEDRREVEKHQMKNSLDNDHMESQVDIAVEDGNGDDCRLCGMDGMLVCCDGCPSVYHARCLGLSKPLAPNDAWYCPECKINENEPKILQGTKLRGGNVFGVDPYEQLFVASCDHLLVGKASSTSGSCTRYYNRHHLPGVLSALYENPECATVYEDIFQGIIQYWKLSRDADSASARQHCEILKTPMSECNSNITESISTKSNNISFPSDTSFGDKVRQELNDRVGNVCESPSSWYLYRGSSFHKTGYINHYLHGDFSASAATHLAILSNEEKQGSECISLVDQVKAFSLAAVRFFWPNEEKKLTEVPRERCGWCVSCKDPAARKRACLLNAAASNDTRQAMKVLAGVQPVKNGSDERLSGITTYILSIEDNLSGLLVGAFLNDTFRKQWRRQLEQAATCTEVNILLLELEENMRSIVFSGEWVKLVEGFSFQESSASQIATGSTQKCRPGRRGKKRSDMVDTVADSFQNKSTKFTWWRGGLMSKLMFQRGVLPRSIINKAARQGGKKKIFGVRYVEGNEIPKISRQLIWRSAVEMSRTKAHLALQVRYLDFHVRWGDLGRREQMPVNGKSSEGETSVFRNASLCGVKIVEHEVRYCVTFGSRRHLPSRVMKNILQKEEIQEGGGCKERFWFSETFIPMYLIREYEQKVEKTKSVNVLSKLQRRHLKASRESIFSVLLSEQGNTVRKCSSCHHDVFYRNAVKCHACQGFCHLQCAASSIVDMSEGTDFLVICKRCCETQVTTQAKNSNGSTTTPLLPQRLYVTKPAISKDANSVFSKGSSTSFGASECYSEAESTTTPFLPQRLYVYKPAISKDANSVWSKGSSAPSSVAKKNTKSNWGITWRKLHCGETGFDFRSRNILLSGNTNRELMKPICRLCDQPYNADLMYICCETCNNWFHADAVELDESKIFNVVGFKCCKCRKTKSPVCPYLVTQNKDALKQKVQHLLATKLEISAKGSKPQQFAPKESVHLESDDSNHVNIKRKDPPESLSENTTISHSSFHDQKKVMTSVETSNKQIWACKFCSKTEPGTDLSCQICCIRIHKTCSPWYESSCHEGDWRCGNCRHWS